MLVKYHFANKTYKFLDEFNLDVNANKFTVIVGKNGTGKSTLLRDLIKKLVIKENSQRFYSDKEVDLKKEGSGEIYKNSDISNILQFQQALLINFLFQDLEPLI